MVALFGRKKSNTSTSSPSTLTPPDLTKPQLKRATRTRKTWSLITSAFLFISVIFLILVEIGGTYNRALIKDWYFIRLDLSHIIPASVPNFALINTIAQTLGLHDFYQVGLWGFCEGYKGQGVTECSHPKTLYWFNPVEILSSQLLAGASSKSVLSRWFLRLVRPVPDATCSLHCTLHSINTHEPTLTI